MTGWWGSKERRHTDVFSTHMHQHVRRADHDEGQPRTRSSLCGAFKLTHASWCKLGRSAGPVEVLRATTAAASSQHDCIHPVPIITTATTRQAIKTKRSTTDAHRPEQHKRPGTLLHKHRMMMTTPALTHHASALPPWPPPPPLPLLPVGRSARAAARSAAAAIASSASRVTCLPGLRSQRRAQPRVRGQHATLAAAHQQVLRQRVGCGRLRPLHAGKGGCTLQVVKSQAGCPRTAA